MTKVQNQEGTYMQKVISWTLKGLSIFTNTRQNLGEIGNEGLVLLKGLDVTPNKELEGRVDVIKIRDMIKKGMEPFESLFRVCFIVTCIFFFTWRSLSCLPIVPTFLAVLSFFFGFVTWEIRTVIKGMKQAYTHLNRIYLQGIHYQPIKDKETTPTITFEQLVAIADCYGQQILCNTWFINGFDIVETSLTNSRPHLEAQIKNIKEKKQSPWKIAEQYFPIITLIYQVANATQTDPN